MGPLAFSTLEPARPPRIASNTVCGFSPRLRRQRQRLAHRLDVRGDDYLVGELGGVARAVAAAKHDAGADDLQHPDMGVEHLLLAADHDGERSINRARLSAGDGGVQELHALRFASRRYLLGTGGRDATHVYHDGAFRRAFQHAVGAEDGGFGVRRVRHHGNHDGGGARHLSGRRRGLAP